LYPYECEARDAVQVRKDAEGEGQEDDEDGTADEGGVEATKKTGHINREALSGGLKQK
jgi:hypothetical protein